MVLESIISPLRAEKKPWELFFIGLLYASIAIFFSLHIFDALAGIIAVFLTVSAAIPIMYQTIKMEEGKDLMGLSQLTVLKEHAHALSFFMFLFMGILMSFTFWYIFLPPEVGANLFSIQIETIKNINANVISGWVANTNMFSLIFFNNVKVLTFCILFSFFYGAGAIFILTWNASVIAVALGSFVRSHLGSYSAVLGFSKVAAYFHVFSLGLLRYLIHGIPEILAYFTGGLAGGIISVAVIKHDFRTKNFERIIFDAADLVLIAIGVLFIAAVIETWITPYFFL